MNRKALVFGGLALAFVGAIMLPKLTTSEKGLTAERVSASDPRSRSGFPGVGRPW